jgi:hypothetical protein
MKYFIITILILLASCVGRDALEEHLSKDCKCEVYTLGNNSTISDGISACARKMGDSLKWGFIDNNDCKQFLPFIYDDAKDYGCGLAPVAKGRLWGAIDTLGNLRIKYKYHNLHTFFDSLATFVDSTHKWGVINMNDVTIVTAQYEYVSDFYSNISVVLNRDLTWGIINSKGKLLPLKIDSLQRGYYTLNHYTNIPNDARVPITGTLMSDNKTEIVLLPLYIEGKKHVFLSFDNKYALVGDSIHIGIIRTNPTCLSTVSFKSIY